MAFTLFTHAAVHAYLFISMMPINHIDSSVKLAMRHLLFVRSHNLTKKQLLNFSSGRIHNHLFSFAVLSCSTVVVYNMMPACNAPQIIKSNAQALLIHERVWHYKKLKEY